MKAGENVEYLCESFQQSNSVSLLPSYCPVLEDLGHLPNIMY